MPLNASLASELKAVLGSDGFCDSQEDLRSFAYDLYASHKPDAVALPKTTEEAAAVLRLCNMHHIPVYPRGSGTSLAGCPVPVLGGVVLCSSRMNKIQEISVTDRLAVVQAGCVTGNLQKAAAEYGLMYPPNPTSCLYSTIGGNVATNAGGASGAKYGVTRDYLLGLTAILPDGTIARLGNRCQKDVTGFDLTRLICGSEGMLAFISEVTVKLVPLPESIRTALAYFSSATEAGAVVTDLVSRRILPCTLELMDHTFLETVAEVYGVPCPPGTGAALLIEVDGPDATLDAQMGTIQEVCTQHHAIGFQRAHTEEERETLWKARRGGTAALVRKADMLVTLDYAVPISSLPRALQAMEELASKHNCNVVTIAHAADGNLHPMVLYSPGDPVQAAAYNAFADASVRAILELGGTISGEHGIGLEKKQYMPLQLGDEQMRIMRGICRIFDPYGIMNPGKLEQ
ncbi:MAG: FAD-binding protein [Mailhella sp.]|nr:FAD-binding protein [Mailhella sp.]